MQLSQSLMVRPYLQDSTLKKKKTKQPWAYLHTKTETHHIE